MHFLAWFYSQFRSKLRLLRKKVDCCCIPVVVYLLSRNQLVVTFCIAFECQMEELKHGNAAEEERYTYRPTLEWNPQVREYLSKAYGHQQFALISDALTRPSCYSCIRVNVLKTTHNIILQRLSSLLYDAKFYKGVEMETLCHMRTVNPNSDCSTGIGAVEKLNDIFGELNMEGMAEVYNLRASRSATSSLLNGMDKSSSLVESPHSSFSYKGLLHCKIPRMEYVIIVRGSGPCKIDYGTGSCKVLKEVIVSRKCAEAVLRGAHVFVPGVLACSAHVEKGDTVAVSVAIEHPDTVGGWIVGITRGTVLSGAETDVYYGERNGLYIGQGIAMMSRAGIFRETQGIAIEMVDRVYRLPPFHGALKGEIFLQNLPSIITAHVLDPRQGERILDLCAAPGGKTTAIAMLMKDKGEVIAIDRSHNKVMDIQNLAQEMGLTCVRAYKLDALKAVKKVNSCNAECSSLSLLSTCKQMDKTVLYGEHVSCVSGGEDDKHANHFQPIGNLTQDKSYGDIRSSNEGRYTSKVEERKVARKLKNGPGRSQDLGGRVEQSKGFEPNSFDRVLLDAPCSALGLRPRLFAGEETLQSLRNHGRYQRRMFDQAVQLVRPGGTIVYSTCTINPGENEALVRSVLDTYSFLSLVPQYPKIGGPGLVGGQDVFDGQSYEEWLRDGEQDLVQRFCPSSNLDTIGFFIAKFKVGEK